VSWNARGLQSHGIFPQRVFAYLQHLDRLTDPALPAKKRFKNMLSSGPELDPLYYAMVRAADFRLLSLAR
jgi:hypothetical protein